MATVKRHINAGDPVLDLWATMVGGSASYEFTPAHTVRMQNTGTGTVRIGDLGDASTTVGLLVAPGEEFHMRVPAGNRLAMVGDAGGAVSELFIMVLTGRDN